MGCSFDGADSTFLAYGRVLHPWHGLDHELSSEHGQPARRGQAPGGRRRVLLVDDHPGILQMFGRALRMSGFDVATATSAQAALTEARRGFDVMLLDVKLGEDNGLDVLRTLRAEEVPGRVVVITGFDFEGIEPEARRLGAEFVDRWTMPDPVELVTRALAGSPAADDQPMAAPVTPPVLTRWAEAVAAAVDAREEPKSVASWAHAIGKSDGSLRALCELAGISAKSSCSLVRVLRAVHFARVSGRMDPTEWLDVADERTKKRLLADGAVRQGGPVSIDEVLRHQRLVTHEAAVGLLSRTLRRRGHLGAP